MLLGMPRPPAVSLKALTPACQRGLDRRPPPSPPPQLPASEIQQTFLTSSLACLLAARPHVHTLSVDR